MFIFTQIFVIPEANSCAAAEVKVITTSVLVMNQLDCRRKKLSVLCVCGNKALDLNGTKDKERFSSLRRCELIVDNKSRK
jgi:hypothetical protein